MTFCRVRSAVCFSRIRPQSWSISASVNLDRPCTSVKPRRTAVVVGDRPRHGVVALFLGAFQQASENTNRRTPPTSVRDGPSDVDASAQPARGRRSRRSARPVLQRLLASPTAVATGRRIAIAVRSLDVYREVCWTDRSEDHIRRHDVAASEVEDVLFSRPRWIAKGREGTTLVFGSTTAGRPLLIVTVNDGGGVALVVTAREMTEQEKRTFRRKAR